MSANSLLQLSNKKSAPLHVPDVMANLRKRPSKLLIRLTLKADQIFIEAHFKSDIVGERHYGQEPLSLPTSKIANRFRPFSKLFDHAAEHDDYGSSDFINELREKGAALYDAVFSESLRDWLNPLLSFGNPDNPIYIEINFDRSILPWELLCFERKNGNRDFLGLNAVCYRKIPLDLPGAQLSIPITITDAYECDYNPTLRSGIRYTKTFEHRFFERAQISGKIALHTIKERKPEKKKQKQREVALDIFDEINSSRPTILHFACHGGRDCSVDEDDYTHDFLRIRQGFSITYDLVNSSKNGRLYFKSRPIVFLNACECDVPRPTDVQTMHSLFHKLKGARAVIAPQFKVGDRQSARFALRFYKYFLRDNCELAWAAFLARRELFFDPHSCNAVGLVYSVLGQEDATLEMNP